MVKKHFNEYYLSAEKVLRVFGVWILYYASASQLFAIRCINVENQLATNQISSIMPLDCST